MLYVLPLVLIIIFIVIHHLFPEERWIRLQDKAKLRTQALEAAIKSLSDFELAANRLETWLNEKAKMLAVLGPIAIEPDILKNQKSQVEVSLFHLFKYCVKYAVLSLNEIPALIPYMMHY